MKEYYIYTNQGKIVKVTKESFLKYLWELVEFDRCIIITRTQEMDYCCINYFCYAGTVTGNDFIGHVIEVKKSL